MCGVLGVGGALPAPLLKELLGDLEHRGPDDQGCWSCPELTLGHRRLTIIGLDRDGRQPMLSRSGGSVIVFNGEIYNYLELADELEAAGRPADRRFDTAVLLEALEAWGVEVLHRLNGMFAFAWYRPRQRSLLLVRDRWGKKPLFWGRIPAPGGGRRLVFSSSLRTFARLPPGPPDPDPLGVARYLVYDGMPGQRTVYRDVFKVPAAGWIELDAATGDELRRGSYWTYRAQARPIEPQAAADRLEALLGQALELRLRSDVPVGLFLSGGIDSSVLAALWRRRRPGDRIRTFTVGFSDPSYDERSSARTMAEFIDSDHHEILVDGKDLEEALEVTWRRLPEPFADPSIIPTSLLCRFARQQVKVAIGGDGADELQAGYDPFRAWRTAKRLRAVLPGRLLHDGVKLCERLVPANPANMSLQFKLHHFAQGLLHDDNERTQAWMASFAPALALRAMREDLAAQVDPQEVLAPSRRAFEAARPAGELHAQIGSWVTTYLESSILTKVDRASMMHSLEVRAPYLDPEVAGSLIDLPPELIFAGGRGKVLLRRLARRLLPAPLLRKPKKGLGVPQTEWLKSILRDRLEAALDRSRTGGWFDHDQIQAIWKAHLAGHYDFRKAMWSFLFASPFQ